jgi:hypothetical protein
LRGGSEGGTAVAAADIVGARETSKKDGVEAAFFDQPGKARLLVEVSVIDHMIVAAHPQPQRLVNHAVHVKRIEIDSLARWQRHVGSLLRFVSIGIMLSANNCTRCLLVV